MAFSGDVGRPVEPEVSAALGDPSEEPAREILRDSLRLLPKLMGQINLEEDVVKINVDWSKLQEASPVQPILLLTALQQHISALQGLMSAVLTMQTSLVKEGGIRNVLDPTPYVLPFIEKLQSVIKAENTTPTDDSDQTKCYKCEINSNVIDKDVQIEEKHTACGSENLKATHVDFDPEVVQIKAGKAEIERRISAFIERKQAEINENNVREFCNVIDCNQENSCARTDAVFTPYPGFKSHVKVSRVVNTYGPQTRSESAYETSHKTTFSRDCGNQAVEERLQNIETHLRLQTGRPVPKDIYQRLKKLEDKILELEGMSPEYFQAMNLSGKRRKIQQNQDYSLAELDEKINALKQTLLRKTNEGRPKVVDQLL